MDLNPIKVTIGGSSMCVGRYLSIDYGIKSHLLTQVSKADDLFSVEFRKLLKKEQSHWANDLCICKANSPECTPITILLKQLDQSYTTMFTHKGALVDFGWNDIQQELDEAIKSSGGVVYLSGFLKSDLSSKFVENLKKIHPKSLVCVDHGRLNIRTDNYSVLTPLYEAFTSGVIDIYICTISEITDFYKAVTGKNYTNESKDSLEILQAIASFEILPLITIVRYTIGERSVSAFSIVGGVVDSIPDHSKSYFDNTPVAPLNAFNASIIKYFSTKRFSTSTSLRGHTIKACQEALEACHRRRKNDPSTV